MCSTYLAHNVNQALLFLCLYTKACLFTWLKDRLNQFEQCHGQQNQTVLASEAAQFNRAVARAMLFTFMYVICTSGETVWRAVLTKNSDPSFPVHWGKSPPPPPPLFFIFFFTNTSTLTHTHTHTITHVRAREHSHTNTNTQTDAQEHK